MKENGDFMPSKHQIFSSNPHTKTKAKRSWRRKAKEFASNYVFSKKDLGATWKDRNKAGKVEKAREAKSSVVSPLYLCATDNDKIKENKSKKGLTFVSKK
jgi:hypothetical protein